MFGIVDKVQKLIALTTSSFEEEARSAAMQACRLIREHRLIVIDELPPPSKPKISKVKPRYHDFPMEIKTKFHSQRCLHCGRVCEHETQVLWLRSVGVTHVGCREHWEVEESSI